LRERLDKKEIIPYIPDYSREEVRFVKTSKDSILLRLDQNGTGLSSPEIKDKLNDSHSHSGILYAPWLFNSRSTDLVELTQVLYIQKGSLQSQVLWVSPLYFVTTPAGTELGVAQAFTTAFNKKTYISRRTIKRAISLGSSQQTIRLDTAQRPETMLKPMYGKNILEALWPQLSSGRFSFGIPGSNQALAFKEVDMRLIDDQEVVVPIYDSLGNIMESKKMSSENTPLRLSAINYIRLQQTWFYSARKNIVYSRINEITLFARKWINGRQQEKPSPVLKILLK
jgi:hypothetical protein